MDERFHSALALLPDYLARHVLLSACALALGIVLGFALYRIPSHDRPRR